MQYVSNVPRAARGSGAPEAADGLRAGSAMPHDRPAEPGFYVVIGETRSHPYRRTRSQRYFGPFAARHQAEMLKTSALSLGIAQPVDGGRDPHPREAPKGVRSVRVTRREAGASDPAQRRGSRSSG